MIEFMVGVGAGLFIWLIVGLLVYRNNRAKWNKLTGQMLAFVDEYKDLEALKAALQNLAIKIKR